MPEQAIQSTGERLFQYGVLGINVFVFGLVIWYLFREMTKERREITAAFDKYRTESETKITNLQKEHTATVERLQKEGAAALAVVSSLRDGDNKAYQQSLLDVTKAGTASMSNVTQLMEQNRSMMDEVRDTMRDLGDDLRRRS